MPICALYICVCVTLEWLICCSLCAMSERASISVNKHQCKDKRVSENVCIHGNRRKQMEDSQYREEDEDCAREISTLVQFKKNSWKNVAKSA